MALFSRAFIRRRAISLATTTTVVATSFALAHDPPRMHHLGRALSIQNVAGRPGYSDEQTFLAENTAAMKKMVADTIEPTGDVDRDFVEMMVPHHQNALEIAQAELKYGHNEQLRRLAQEIVTTQQHEIAVMQLALLDKLPPPVATKPQYATAPASRGDAMPSSSGPHDALR